MSAELTNSREYGEVRTYGKVGECIPLPDLMELQVKAGDGVVLSPTGGALQRLLLPFSLCLGGRIGSGKQYISWIDMEDVIGSVYHVLVRKDVAGPVNIVSPDPITNMQLTSSLGRVLSRPTPLPLPETMIKFVFGQMGTEILLASTRVMPEVLLKSGYRFRNPELLMSLRHMLGKS